MPAPPPQRDRKKRIAQPLDLLHTSKAATSCHLTFRNPKAKESYVVLGGVPWPYGRDVRAFAAV